MNDLPPDLLRALRDPTIVLARDHEVRCADGRTLHEHLEIWRNAPSNTTSAHIPGESPIESARRLGGHTTPAEGTA